MRDLKRGDRVRWLEGAVQLTGMVMGGSDNPLLAGIRVDGGGAKRIPRNRLRRAVDQILFLEARLDRSLRSTRQPGEMYLAYLRQAHGLKPLHERVHHLQDIIYFVRLHGADCRIVHISCHGERDSFNTRLVLSRDQVYLRRKGRIASDQLWLRDLAGKIVFLSCCEIGSDVEALSAIAKRNRLDLLVAYADTVYDGFAFLAEMLLYDRLLTRPHHLKQTISEARWLADVLHKLRYDSVRSEDRSGRMSKSGGPVMRIFSAGSNRNLARR